MKDFFRIERLRQEIITAEIQHLCPESFVGKAVAHDQRRRTVHRLHFAEKVIPAVAVRQSDPADDHSGG